MPLASPRSAHVGRRVHVHARETVARVDVRAGMQEPGRVEKRLREFFVAGSLLVSVVHDGREAAIARCAEGDALDCVRPIADPVIHLAPRQHHLDRAPSDAGAERGQRHVRPGAQGGAESAANEGRDDADVLCRNAEHGGNFVGRVVHPLRLVPQRQAVAVPRRDGGVHLNRIVVLARDHVGVLHLDLGCREGSVRIAAPRLRRPPLPALGSADRDRRGNIGDPGFVA